LYNKAAIYFERTDLQGEGSLHLATSNTGNSTSVTKSDARLTITKDGNVGIGTTSADYKLTVLAGSGEEIRFYRNATAYLKFGFGTANAAIYSGGDIQFLANGSSVNSLIINASLITLNEHTYVNGNLGIGTSSPSAKLHVAVDGTSEILLERTTNLSGMPSQIRIKTVGSEWALANNLAGTNKFSIRDVTNNSHVMVFDTNGNVGIGTTSPKAPLHVGTGSAGNYFGGKTFSLSNTFADALSITLSNHTACYVRIFVNGDWSSHSSVAFVGEYFIQNGSNSYNQPGLIISETDNTYNGSVSSQIVDSTTDTFVIQLKLSTTGSFTANLSYQVMGSITSIS